MFPCEQVDGLSATQSEGVGLIVSAISFTEKLVTAGYLKLIVVVKISRLEVFLADNLNDGVLELFLEGNVLTAGVQVIQQLLTSTHTADYH